MVSLLPAGRALSIVTNTVVRTVAEERGAYSELFSTRLLQRGRLKKDSRIVVIYRGEERGQKICRWRALGKNQRGERDGGRNDNYDRVVVDSRTNRRNVYQLPFILRDKGDIYERRNDASTFRRL